MAALEEFHERRWGGAYEQPRVPAGSSKGGQFTSKNPTGVGAQLQQDAGGIFAAEDWDEGLSADTRERIVGEMGKIGITPEGTKAMIRQRMERAKTMPDPYPIRPGTNESAYTGGRRWYRRAHAEAVLIGDGDPKIGAGILAAMSPQCLWPYNVNAASAVRALAKSGLSDDDIVRHFLDADLRTGVKATFGNLGPQNEATVRNALRIIHGEPPGDVLGGQKVRNFFNNMVSTKQVGHVTIDGHMYKALLKSSNLPPKERKKYISKITKDWKGGPGGPTKRNPTADVDNAGYQFMAGMIRQVAREEGMSPEQVQAILWNTAVKEKWDD